MFSETSIKLSARLTDIEGRALIAIDSVKARLISRGSGIFDGHEVRDGGYGEKTNVVTILTEFWCK